MMNRMNLNQNYYFDCYYYLIQILVAMELVVVEIKYYLLLMKIEIEMIEHIFFYQMMVGKNRHHLFDIVVDGKVLEE